MNSARAWSPFSGPPPQHFSNEHSLSAKTGLVQGRSGLTQKEHRVGGIALLTNFDTT